MTKKWILQVNYEGKNGDFTDPCYEGNRLIKATTYEDAKKKAKKVFMNLKPCIWIDLYPYN